MTDTQKIDKTEVFLHMDRAKGNLLSFVRSKISNFDEAQVNKAVEFTILAHTNQYRKSGMPFVEHPFEVAKILANYQVDNTTIIASLLHDVVEDTDITIPQVENEFGHDVAFLVEAVTKISKMQSKSRLERKAETFRKMLLSMAKDFRVILIKFADRLHNMRTLRYMRDDKKKHIATETMEIYAPLAHRFGLAKIRWELEDLAFKTLNPNAYKNLVDKVVGKRVEREATIRELVQTVRTILEKSHLDAKVYGRPKHFYSIHNKMKSRQCPFEDVYDLFAIRIIVKSITDCYMVLGLVHELWPPLQARFKDFIATPKANMYQSLHTTLVGPNAKPVEVQIRTEDMELTAEHGIAAHWAYKEKTVDSTIKKENKWLSQFVDWQKDLTDSSEFIDFFKVDIDTDEIYVFTPEGDLHRLPAGATALDFAFAIHSELGIRCIGVKVDGKAVPLDKLLRTGSTVEVLKSNSQHPSRDWLRMVKTPKAKNRIRRWLKSEEKEKSILLGKELLMREFRDLKTPQEIRANFEPYEKRYNVETWKDFYQQLGNGDISVASLSNFIKTLQPREKSSVLNRMGFKKQRAPKNAVLVSGMTNILIHYASCCQPIPGDNIIGFITKGRGISIHRAKCPEAVRLSKNKDHLIPVEWNEDLQQDYDVFLEVLARDKKGLLTEMTKAFSKAGVNVERASIVTVKGQVRNRFKIQVNGTKQVDEAILRLKQIKEVKTIYRKPFSNIIEENDS